MLRPTVQTAQPDAEDRPPTDLIGDEVADLYPDTYPDPEEC